MAAEAFSKFAPQKKDIANARKRYDFFVKFLEKQKDEGGLELLNDLIKNCKNYVHAVVQNFLKSEELKNATPGQKMIIRMDISSLDEARRISHNALISRIEMINRYVSQKYGWQSAGGKIPIGGIFSLSPDVLQNPYAEGLRRIVGDWAFFLYIGLFGAELKV